MLSILRRFFVQSSIWLVALIFFSVTTINAQNPWKLWYEQPAQKWTDALPIGNGSIGAMIYGTVQEEHLQFNESSLWTGRPRDYQRNGAAEWLPIIRKLLAEGKQKTADSLAEKHFMGLKDVDENFYASQKKAWLTKVRKDTSNAAEALNEGNWMKMQLPTINGWETDGREALDGSVWFRTHFILPKSMVGIKMKLDLGRIRDLDYTYINGKLVGSNEGISTKRSYIIDASVLHEGDNTIAIQVINYYDKGGFIGIKEARKIFVLYDAKKDPETGIELSTNWKYTIQNDSPPAFPQYQASYQPFGDVYFSMNQPSTTTDYHRQLDISTAIARTIFTSAGTRFSRTYFASVNQNVIVNHFTANKSGKINLTASLKAIHRNWKVKKIDNHTIALYVQVANGALRGVSYLHVNAKNGTVEVINNQLKLSNVDSADFYLIAATNYKNFQDISADPELICKKRLQAINNISYQQVLLSHLKNYQEKFNRFSVQFGADQMNLPTDVRIKAFSPKTDPNFLALYMQYGRYLLIASSMGNAKQPANLQGIWNNLLTPPWGSKYTSNINLQMNYWPSELLNLSESTIPLFNAIKELSVSGKKTAKEHYGIDGWVLHHNTDLWRGTAPINAANHGIWVTGGAWLGKHIWEHYLFTMDTTFLRTNYPIMKSAAAFFTKYLILDPSTGYLISGPSNSPEQGGLVLGPTMDHQIIRELYKNTISAAKILQVDQGLQQLLNKQYKQIAPNKIGQYGQLQEWLKDVDDTANKHRHVSHLWAVFPGTDITWEDPTMMRAAKQSLLYRGDDATGWSLAWKTNLWARFKDGEHAMLLAQRLLSNAEDENSVVEKSGVYKNLFDAHPPFQIDGNFGGAAGFAEMLVQSHMGYIDILPALPKDLQTGMVKGLMARGGFELALVWENTKLKKLLVYSKAGADCELRYGKKRIVFKTEKGKKYLFNGDLQLQNDRVSRQEISLNKDWISIATDSSFQSLQWFLQQDKKKALLVQSMNTQLEMEKQTGVGDMYSLTFKYANTTGKNGTLQMRFKAMDGTLLKAETLRYTTSIAGKWNYITTNTGTMINAGNNKIQIDATNAIGIFISGVDVQ